MAKKSSKAQFHSYPQNVAEPCLQPITETIEKNYMPYAMSVIISRAIPAIDGFKPVHRKVLYSMYKMGLLGGNFIKSANAVGQAMQLHPHGDSSIYETMVRLARGNEALLHPFVDSKGSFGKHYSSDMQYAASRYTEVRLDKFCAEIFRGIDKDAVDFVDNYDGTTTEPVMLPTSFPNILLSPNLGIAVGMASKICSFNLSELCDGTIALLKNPGMDVDSMLDLIKAPDFPGGGLLVYNRAQLSEIYKTGTGSFKVRAKYVYNAERNCIEVLEIPYSTSIELIINSITDLVKEGKLKEITDFRDEIDLSGFKFTLDLRKNTDPDLLMAKLYKMTPLEDTFSCNFNVLINNSPKVMGVIEILSEWIKFRMECIRRETKFVLGKKEEKLHLLIGLGKILLDIDKAIRIIRETEHECDVVPNLMSGFSLDQVQAEYIADIKLRNLNREYILNRISEIDALQKEIAELRETVGSDSKIKKIIEKQLKEIKEKYAKPRQTQLLFDSEIKQYKEEEHIDNYNVRIVLTKEGYFKKITMQSLRGSDEQKLKEGDEIFISEDTENIADLYFFTDKSQIYHCKVSDFDDTKASLLGDFVATKLGFDENERPVFVKALTQIEPKHKIVYLFENGKGVRVPFEAYLTKTNRRKLTSAFSSASPVKAVFYEDAPFNIMIKNNAEKALVVNSEQIPIKTTRTSMGVAIMKLRPKQFVVSAERGFEKAIPGYARYQKAKLPAPGTVLAEKDIAELQISLLDL
ncbi:MAG: topoisomerase IV [Clostridia bacterium]|nr:topoisomerase IV [Clostridia bacterium]